MILIPPKLNLAKLQFTGAETGESSMNDSKEKLKMDFLIASFSFQPDDLPGYLGTDQSADSK